MSEINPGGLKLKKEHLWNLLYMYYCMNELRAEFGKPMICTSGVRSIDEQKLIYRKINLERQGRGLEEIKVPLNSPHISAAATDWQDPKSELYTFLTIDRQDLMEELDLYVELKSYTPHHTHIQTIAPKSGKRIFVPY